MTERVRFTVRAGFVVMQRGPYVLVAYEGDNVDAKCQALNEALQGRALPSISDRKLAAVRALIDKMDQPMTDMLVGDVWALKEALADG